MRVQTKVSLAIALAMVIGIVSFLALSGDDEGGPVVASTPEQTSALVRDDSHVLGEDAAGDVTFVEFLDFECEACRAAFPVVEDMRKQYAGDVTFVMRYFPLPSHFNSERAARTVEAAARQGRLEDMYTMMFETQASWGESREPADDLFRTYAEDLGLDMAQFDADYADPEVAARVQRDVDDGIELGVEGTPTFFINGEPFLPETVGDFNEVLDAALAE
ncbi:thioredoxin domain-containing protein [Nocardioides sp.]|jgi:protein-disulfide isomerase|uniref:DsbA family protein n=1 Tax=Nocardioides sp. TaxID=35761 RepID=UPI000C8AA6AE|nr:thioredoxin domain-containing protein [Nocardioides sp.]MAS53405.1 thioredoxin [Pimelobacter sp.]MDE0776534.1 thioredoxin domain-containing protein [Nocardioides sp.]